MTKEYFSHDYGTRHKKKLAALIKEKKMRGYGLFWAIVEMLHEDSTQWMELDDMTYIAIEGQTGESVTYIKDFISACISRYRVFIQEGNRFTTERVLKNIGKRMEIKELRSKAGKASAEKKQQNSTHVQHTSTHVEQNSTKERKVKESKEKKNYSKWDQYPTAETQLTIEDAEVTLAIEFVSRTKGKLLSEETVKNFFEAFRINLSGEFKSSRGTFMQHFRNWLKDRNIPEVDNKPQTARAPQEQNEW